MKHEQARTEGADLNKESQEFAYTQLTSDEFRTLVEGDLAAIGLIVESGLSGESELTFEEIYQRVKAANPEYAQMNKKWSEAYWAHFDGPPKGGTQ